MELVYLRYRMTSEDHVNITYNCLGALTP